MKHKGLPVKSSFLLTETWCVITASWMSILVLERPRPWWDLAASLLLLRKKKYFKCNHSESKKWERERDVGFWMKRLNELSQGYWWMKHSSTTDFIFLIDGLRLLHVRRPMLLIKITSINQENVDYVSLAGLISCGVPQGSVLASWCFLLLFICVQPIRAD